MVKHKSTYSDDHRQAGILIAFLINEMATADGYESLHEVTTIDRAAIDRYASYSAAALDGVEKYRQLSVGVEQTREQAAKTAIFFMSEAIAAVDGIVPVTKKHIRYAKAARHAIQTYQKRPAKGGDK